MAHQIPTITTDELLERIAAASGSGWRHDPPALQTRDAARRPRFERVSDRHLGGLEARHASA